MAEGEEKTERASEFKLKEARKKGQVAKSADFVSLLSLSCVLFTLFVLGSFLFKRMSTIFHQMPRLFSTHESTALVPVLKEMFDGYFFMSIPLLAAASVGAVIGNLSQFGFLFSTHPLKPDLQRINPIKGIKKLFSKDRFFELVKQLIKFILIFWIVIAAIKDIASSVSRLFRLSLIDALSCMGECIVIILSRVLLCFLMVSLIDWFWQRFSFAKSMRMSKYEVKKEYKQQEGDPHIKQERRRIHQELAESGGMNALENATLLVANPSHLAIALRYNEELDAVPLLIAKASGNDAKSLIAKAQKMHIPVIRNVVLARDLIWLDLNEEIPEHLYEAVAEVLTFVMELNQKHKAQYES